MSKSRVFLRIIVGGYLAYLGGGLVKDAFIDKPEHYIGFMAAGILFLIFGLWWMLLGVKMAARHEYDDPDDLDDSEDYDDDDAADDMADEENPGIEDGESEQTTKEED